MFGRIWQHFSCLLDEGIPKIWKKLNFHDGFLSYLQNSTATSAHLAANFFPALVCPQKSHRENSISSIFLESPHQVDMKKRCQILQRLFWVFQYSRNSQCGGLFGHARARVAQSLHFLCLNQSLLHIVLGIYNFA